MSVIVIPDWFLWGMVAYCWVSLPLDIYKALLQRKIAKKQEAEHG